MSIPKMNAPERQPVTICFSAEKVAEGINRFVIEVTLEGLSPKERDVARRTYEDMFQHSYANFYEEKSPASLTAWVTSGDDVTKFVKGLKAEGISLPHGHRLNGEIQKAAEAKNIMEQAICR